MKHLIQKFLANKKLSIPAGIILVVLIGAATYTLTGINQNVQQMTDALNDAAAPYFPDYPANNAQGKDANLIKRGEYLTKAGDCMACHTNTPEKGKQFAGGLPMPTPFGTIYTPNITPDKETGIGNWTDAQFLTAMHKGISPKGYYYYPAFPYIYFSKVTDDDIKAIKAYLDSIPAVHQENRANAMVWPFNRRLLQLPWRLMFFHPNKVYQATPQASEQWKRGEYIVEGLGHCAMCHTPSYYILSPTFSLGAPMQKYNLTGTKIQGYLAPNITKANLSKVNDSDIIDVFTKDQLIGGGHVEGPMLEVNHDSMKYMSPEDLNAIATYLRTVQSATPPKPRGGAGKATYETYCSGCHATGAGGAPKYADAMSWTPILAKGMPDVYNSAIKGIGGMPAKGTCLSCSDDDIKLAVNYMVASVSSASGKLPNIKPLKALTMADGKRIYDNNCSACHNTGFHGAPKPGDMKTWKPIIAAGFLNAYEDVVSGHGGHPLHGACPTCNDAELLASVKYMMQQSTTTENFELW